MGKLQLINELLYGPRNPANNTREGGLFYISESRIGRHTLESKLAFGVLEHCIRDGVNPNRRDKEKDFLAISGKSLCKFLELDYDFVVSHINYIWES